MDCSLRVTPRDDSNTDNTIWEETSVADRKVMEMMIKDVSWMYQEVETFSWKEHITTVNLHLKNGVLVSEEEFLKSFSDYLLESEENYFTFEYQLRYKLSEYLTELRNKKIENIIYE